MPSGRIDTMTDYLRQIMGLLSDAKIVADADLPFILDLEQQVVQKLRDPQTRMQQAGILPADASQIPGGGAQMQPGGGAQQGPPPDMNMQGPPPSAGPSFQGAGGVRGVPTGPNVDELRRLLTAHGQ